MANYIGRRKFLTSLGGAAAAWPLASRAQQRKSVSRVGILTQASGLSPIEEAFRQGLRDFGYVEGQNLVVDYQQGERVRCNRRAYASRARQSGLPPRIAALLQEPELLGWSAGRNVELDVRLAGPATAAAKNNSLRPGRPHPAAQARSVM
jgi:hypothetical protein